MSDFPRFIYLQPKKTVTGAWKAMLFGFGDRGLFIRWDLLSLHEQVAVKDRMGIKAKEPELFPGEIQPADPEQV